MHANLSRKIKTWDGGFELRNTLEHDFPALTEYLIKHGQSPGKTPRPQYGRSASSLENIKLVGGENDAHLKIGNDHDEGVTVEFLTKYLLEHFATIERAKLLLAHLTGFHKAWSQFLQKKEDVSRRRPPVAFGTPMPSRRNVPEILFPNNWSGFDKEIQTIIDSVLQRPEIELIMRLGSDSDSIEEAAELSPPSIEVGLCFERYHGVDRSKPVEPAVVRADQYIEFGLTLLKNSDRHAEFLRILKEQVTERSMEVFRKHVDNGLSDSIYKLVRKTKTDIRDRVNPLIAEVGCT